MPFINPKVFDNVAVTEDWTLVPIVNAKGILSSCKPYRVVDVGRPSEEIPARPVTRRLSAYILPSLDQPSLFLVVRSPLHRIPDKRVIFLLTERSPRPLEQRTDAGGLFA